MRTTRLLSLVCLSALLGACPPPEEDPAAALHALFEREWEFRLEEDPLFATSVGRHEWNDRLPSVAVEDLDRRAGQRRAFLAELGALDHSRLDELDRINYDMFERQLDDAVADHGFGSWQIPLNADSGFHSSFARLPEEVPLAHTADYENYLSRLRAFPVYAGQQVDNMRRGMERGMTLPRVVLDGIDDTIASHVVDDPEASVFWAPFASFPTGVPESEHERLRQAGREAIAEAVVPAYRSFLEFMNGGYVPAARATLAASDLPDGPAYYAHRIRHFTTLDLTPEEIHRIGLDEVARIRAEMEAIIERVGFGGTFAEFLEFLRTDQRFYPESAEDLLRQASYIAKRMDGKLPALFKTLPRLPYGVAPVPEHMAPKYTAGRYVAAPRGSTQPGYYWVNTYALESRTLYTLEALTLHEAVPGHHLQIALANEQEDLPEFRRFSYISAFGEGWGLYSERLGLEAGLYTDPYSDFGRLTYEMWRACRLVVDTGLHALGWTREQARDYLAGNTALALHEVRTETDRYISWPAQALAYKLGELKIRELRRRAEEALGERFDIREFHDAVLLHGAVPLPVLEGQIESYIERARTGAGQR